MQNPWSMKRILASVVLGFLFLGCSGGDDGGGDGAGGTSGAAGSSSGGSSASGGSTAGGVTIACTNTANGCTEYHLPAGTNTTPVSDPCVQLGGTATPTCSITPFAGCCVIETGKNEICYYGVYASDPQYDLDHSCTLAGGVWTPAG